MSIRGRGWILLALLAGTASMTSCRDKSGPPSQDETEVSFGVQDREGNELPAIVSSKEAEMATDYEITDEQKAWLMKVAKESSAAAARGESYEPPRPAEEWKVLADKGAAFVTLRRKSDGALRGCIGHIIARIPLYECVAEMGRAATIQDSRFSPVTPSELDGIHYEISVLTPLQPVDDPENIEVGRDGVVLSIGYHHGVFLPQVPVEQGWDRTEYLDNLCYKAGLMRKGCWREEGAKLESFQAIVWEEAL